MTSSVAHRFDIIRVYSANVFTARISHASRGIGDRNYMYVCLSVRLSLCLSVCPSVARVVT